MKNKLAPYITESVSNSKTQLNESRVLNGISLVFKDKLIKDIDLEFVFDKIKSTVPEKFLYNIDAIYIGHFNEMEVKHVNAFYQDGTIYVSNVQDDEADMIDDIIHEIAHAVEEQYGMQLYSDGEIEKEFMIKRHKLENILKYHEFETKGLDFQNLKFNPAFDELLHIKIGYPTLSTLSSGLFYSPYGITSLREYFSEIFEAFFNKREWSALRKISPAVINKIDQLLEKE